MAVGYVVLFNGTSWPGNNGRGIIQCAPVLNSICAREGIWFAVQMQISISNCEIEALSFKLMVI
jgi:hypothetical protein